MSLHRLPAERAGQPAPAELAASRSGLAKGVAAGAFRTEPAAEEAMIGGVRTLRFRPPGPSAGTILHMHGGGFRIGCPEMVGPFAAALARRCNVTVICPNYRLAPEYPFPAGIADGNSVLQNLNVDERRKLILSGDSAGGGLAASLASLALNDAVRPIGLMLFSPWLDLTVTSDSYRENAATDPVFSIESATAAAALYLQGMAPNDPLASPVFGDVTGFAPTLISAGSGEVLVEDSRVFAAKLRMAGVTVQLDVFPGMEHVAVTRGMQLPGASETFELAASFINNILL